MDKIIHAVCFDGQISIAAISARKLVSSAQSIHGLSRTATAALGRDLMMTALMASRLKDERESVSTIFAGHGAGGNLVCVGSYGAIVKGCVMNPSVELPPKPNGKLDVGGYVGCDGRLSVVREFAAKEPYVGVCELVSGEVAEDYAQYFTQSEQQPSIVYLGVSENALSGEVLSAGGLWIQALPDCSDETIDAVSLRSAEYSKLGERLKDGEELEAILTDLFGSWGYAQMSRMNPVYRCDCSRERMERALISLGKQELTELLIADGQAELVCHFCNKRYFFNENELAALVLEAENGRS